MTAAKLLPTNLASRVRFVGDCWEWTGKITQGYGRIETQGRSIQAHRIVYQLLVGPVPEGKQLDHLCRNKRCVNPAHLEPVTSKQNTMRGFGPTAIHARKTHCTNGHPLSGDHVRTNESGHRRCMTCRTERDEKRNIDRRAATRDALAKVAP